MEGWYVKRWSHSSEAHPAIYDSILKPKYLEYFPQDCKTAFMFINIGTKGKGQFCQSASVATKLCWLSGICGALPTSFAEGFFFKTNSQKECETWLFKANWCLNVGTCNPEAILALRELLLNKAAAAAMQKHETKRKVDDSSALEKFLQKSCQDFICHFTTLADCHYQF